MDPCNPDIPNIDAISGALFTLRIQYEYTQKQCVGVAIEGMDIWYMSLITNLTDCHPNVSRIKAC